MILNPFSTRRIEFFDWDDTITGVLILPKAWIGNTHDNITNGSLAISREERDAKRDEARKRWPRQRIYPEERYYYVLTDDGGLELRHSLRYLPSEYIKLRTHKGFRPKGGAESG